MKYLLPAVVLVAGLAMPQSLLAHRSGCHTLHTCPSDSDTYICGDLGYPCDGSTSINDIALSVINVPLLIEVIFEDTFERKPNDTESAYWKKRFRDDKGSVHKVRRVMAWHKANGSFGPKVATQAQTTPTVVPRINALFRLIFDGRNPTQEEHSFWLQRVLRGEKTTAHELIGAMQWHKLFGS